MSENAESQPIESTDEDSTSSFLAGKESETAESSESSSENSKPAAENSTAPKTERSAQTAETQAPPATETPAPKQETATLPPIETPQETVPPPEPPIPDFEVGGYVEQAKSYGQSIGLSLDSAATACWDNPTYASAKASNISGNLSLLDWYKDSGFTGFWVWAEDLGNGEFNIYIGYA